MKILYWPRLNRALRRAGGLTLAQAQRGLGQVDAALHTLAAAHPREHQARLMRAWLLAAQSEVDEAKALLAETPARTFGERLADATVRATIALQERQPDEILAQAETWGPLRDGNPTSVRGVLDLLEASACVLKEQPDAARAVLARSGTRLADFPWLPQAMPLAFALTKDLGADPDEEVTLPTAPAPGST